MKTMPWVCHFSELDKSKLSWVGGKGANLGEMTQQGFPIPGGFCVTTASYHEFLKKAEAGKLAGLFQRLKALQAEDTDTARTLGAEIRDYLRDLPMPEEVEQQIVKAWKDVGEEHSYAVRSSATAEDLPDASFAGQQDTYLNIRGQDSLLEHVRRCWASLFTDRAIVYRARNKFDHEEVALSVVIQRMVLPEVSGILFTADPLSENRHIISIDASFGLGEALVSGMVTPDFYRIDKRNNTIVEVNVADKGIAIRPLPDGGTFEEKLSDELRHARVLTDKQIQELATLGQRIEEHYGSPQDIEWCLEGDTFHIVQSRPITSLYPPFTKPHPDPTLQAYFCMNYQQVMTDPISPMGQSSLEVMIPFGKWYTPQATQNPYMNFAGGRIYMNMTPVLRHPKVSKGLIKGMVMMDELASLSVQQFVERDQFVKDIKKGPVVSLGWIIRNVGFPMGRRVLGFLFFKNTKDIVKQRTALLEEIHQEVEDVINEHRGNSLARFQAIIKEFGSIFQNRLLSNFFSVAITAMASGKLVGRLTGKPDNDPDLSAFMRAYEGNVTTDMDLELGDIADVIRSHPDLLQHFQEHSIETIEDDIASVNGGQEFLDEFTQFLDKYGARAASEIDIARPRWWEEHTPLLQMLIGNLSDGEPGKHRKQHKRLAQEAEQARERLIQSVNKGLFGWFKKKLVSRITRVHRDLMGIREHHKWLIIRSLSSLKHALHEEAETFIKAGLLQSKEDIFFLRLDEVTQLAEGHWDNRPEELIEQINQRRADHKRWFHLTPPRILTSDGEIVRAELTAENAPEGAIIGSAASSGVIEGRARVVLSPNNAVLQNGEILIAPFTDPGWTPLFIHAGGLVMEVGGLMTHGSVVAREYGIPAVVCVPNVTKTIKTGQWIRVNGDQGYVEILEEPAE